MTLRTCLVFSPARHSGHPGRVRLASARAHSLWSCVALLAGLSGLGAADHKSPSAAMPPAVFEAGEDMPGGEATSRASTTNNNAFSLSSGNMPFADEFKFKIGNGVFKKIWVSSPSSTRSSDGLGPLFNARSCQTCHIKDGRGHPPPLNGQDGNAISMLMRLSVPGEPLPPEKAAFGVLSDARPEPTYGTQLQDLSIQGHAAEGRIRVTYSESTVTLANGQKVKLRKPAFTVADLGYGPMAADTQYSPRMATPMIGLGLLEAIPQDALLTRADPDDKDGDGISGRANWVKEDDGPALIGRFGWKAGNATVAQQSAEAFAGDMGISSPLLAKPSGDCTPNQPLCMKAPNGNTPPETGAEVNKDLFDLVVFYSRNLGVPVRRDPQAPKILRGKAAFSAIGCASCHVPSHMTGAAAAGNPHLGRQRIWPYTDLLLHDMGEGLADNRPERDANGREWRTPPLWGVGLTQTVNGHTFFLHDGRARNVLEAILWHGGEAERARAAFAGLPKADRDALIAFVNSL